MTDSVILGDDLTVQEAAPPRWLVDLKSRSTAMRSRGERPPGKAHGRWLGDFLDQDTDSGLLPAEEKLVLAAIAGAPCILQSDQSRRDAYFSAISESQFAALATEVAKEAALAAQSEQIDFPDIVFSPSTQSRIDAAHPAIQDFFPELARCVMLECRWGSGPTRSLSHEEVTAVQQRCLVRFSTERWRMVDCESGRSHIRAGLVRFLAQGGDETAPAHEKGLSIYHGYMPDQLDLSGCVVPIPLTFFCCHFDSAISFVDARLKSLNCHSTRVDGIEAESVATSGGVFLHGGFRSTGVTNFMNANINGRLSLEGATLAPPFGKTALNLSVAEFIGSVYLNQDLEAQGWVTLSGTTVHGTVYCGASRFYNRSADGNMAALDCSAANIHDSVNMQDGFLADGEVNFVGAEIGGNLLAQGGQFRNWTSDGSGVALNCQGMKLTGNAFLDNYGEGDNRRNFNARGAVRLNGSVIDGDLNLVGGVFDNEAPEKSDGSSSWRPRAARALYLSGSTIKGTLWMGPHAADHLAKATIKGTIDLIGCHAHQLVDHATSWPEPYVRTNGERLPAYMMLDGFTYDRFTGSGQSNSKTRMKWLARQSREHLGVNFKPQPFEHLIKVYREMGLVGEARKIGLLKHRWMRSAWIASFWHGVKDRPTRPAGRPWLQLLAWPFAVAARTLMASLRTLLQYLEMLVWGLGAGYGYGWGRLLAALLVLWLGGAFVYFQLADQGGMAPTTPSIYLNADLKKACSRNWTRCAASPREMSSFNPLIYSLDNMVIALDLGQRRDWQPAELPDGKTFMLPLPAGHAMPIPPGSMDWFQLGHKAASLSILALLFGMISGLIKRD